MLWKCFACKKEFKRPKSKVGVVEQYCTKECYEKLRLERNTKKCICGVCGKEWRNPIKSKGDQYCSIECYWEAVGRIEDKKCETCGKVFHPHQRSKANKYCSSICYAKSITLPKEEFRRRRRAYLNKYRAEHKEWTQAVKSKYRAEKHGHQVHFTTEDWRKIKLGQENKCNLCGKEGGLTVDHIIPLSKGGTNHPSNIQGLCRPCNTKKSWIIPERAKI